MIEKRGEEKDSEIKKIRSGRGADREGKKERVREI